MGVVLTPREKVRLHEVARQYAKHGYRVILQPRGNDLPSFLRGLHPDMVALSSSDSVVVEVKTRRTLRGDRELERMATRVAQQPGWRLEFVLTNPRKDTVAGAMDELLQRHELRKRLTLANTLARRGEYAGAFLTAWTVLEGALRHLAESEPWAVTHRPSAHLLKELRSLGILSKDEYVQLQHAFNIRNRVVHGYIAKKDRKSVV